MITLVIAFIGSALLELVTADLAKARVDEDPVKYAKYRVGFWARVNKWEGRYFGDRNVVELRRMQKRGIILLLVALALAVAGDALLWQWEIELFHDLTRSR